MKTSLRLTRGRNVVFSAAFPTGLGLRRLPEASELAGDEGLSRCNLVNKHSRVANTIQEGVRHAVLSKGNDSAVMSQMANNDSQATHQAIHRS